MIAYYAALNDTFPASNRTVSLSFIIPDPPGDVVSNFARVCVDCASWCLAFAIPFDHIDPLLFVVYGEALACKISQRV